MITISELQLLLLPFLVSIFPLGFCSLHTLLAHFFSFLLSTSNTHHSLHHVYFFSWQYPVGFFSFRFPWNKVAGLTYGHHKISPVSFLFVWVFVLLCPYLFSEMNLSLVDLKPAYSHVNIYVWLVEPVSSQVVIWQFLSIPRRKQWQNTLSEKISRPLLNVVWISFLYSTCFVSLPFSLVFWLLWGFCDFFCSFPFLYGKSLAFWLSSCTPGFKG